MGILVTVLVVILVIALIVAVIKAIIWLGLVALVAIAAVIAWKRLRNWFGSNERT